MSRVADRMARDYDEFFACVENDVAMTYDAWLLWAMENYPERFRESPEAAPEAKTLTDTEEARQWRRGRSQGLLSPVSPLRRERSRA